jgi:DNA-binding MarR family transcriptional regulator
MNRTVLESAHGELLTYREKLTTAIDALGAFLDLPSVLTVVAPAAAPSVAVPDVHTGPRRTTSQTDRPAKPAARTRTASSSGEGQRILEALAKASPQRPSVLMEALELSPHTFKKATATLEEQALLEFSGKTINRQVAITDKGRKAITRTASTELARPQSDAEVVAARDAAIKARLKTGPATFEQLLATLPGDFASADAKASALKASLRRLTRAIAASDADRCCS